MDNALSYLEEGASHVIVTSVSELSQNVAILFLICYLSELMDHMMLSQSLSHLVWFSYSPYHMQLFIMDYSHDLKD